MSPRNVAGDMSLRWRRKNSHSAPIKTRQPCFQPAAVIFHSPGHIHLDAAERVHGLPAGESISMVT